MKKLFYTALFLLSFQATLFSQFANLYVSDPQSPWWNYQGTIEEATLSIKPHGLYWEYGLYLTFSARGSIFGAGDSLEVLMRFELPENAIVIDSWLWINEDISKARILDRWTAGNIYEGIVQRRQDPSILYKNTATNYELRVFPMEGSQTRKVKITYLMPADWTATKVSAELPLHILRSSYFVPEQLNIVAWPSQDWDNPAISLIDGAHHTFTPNFDPVAGPYFETALPYTQFTLQPKLIFDSPMQEGAYLRFHSDNNGSGFYQLAMLPQVEDLTPSSKKLLVLIDKDITGSTTPFNQVLASAKNHLLLNLQPTDSFNLIFSKIPIARVSERWLPAHPDTIEAAFAAVSPTDFSNFGQLLLDGINFIKEQGNEGEIVMLSSSAQYNSIQLASALYDLVLEELGDLRPKIHFLDYRTVYGPWVYIAGYAYRGNEYLYYRLSQLTGGAYYISQNSTLGESMSAVFANADSELKNVDLYTTMEQGFCFGRYWVHDDDVQHLHRPLLQIGRYNGAFPFNIELVGELNGELFFKELSIPENEALSGDSLTREMWVGKRLQHLEASTPPNSIILDIINASIDERVLTRYTAFLCLEDSTQYCPECYDETELTSTETPTLSQDSLLSAYPNPFTDQVKVTFNKQLLKGNPGRVIFEIYNLNGQLIRQVETNAGAENVQMVWDGRNASGDTQPAGVYVLNVQSGTWTGVMKLVKQ